MSEQDPTEDNWTFGLGGQPFEMTPQNGSLYTFLGKLVIDGMEVPAEEINHVYLVRGIDEEKKEAHVSHIFKQHPAYERLSQFMISHSYPLFLNQRKVIESDVEAWKRATFGDLDQGIPEDWQ